MELVNNTNGNKEFGVDSGGSKTIGLLTDEQGKILGLNYAGPSNYQALRLEDALTNINRAITFLGKNNRQREEDTYYRGLACIGCIKDKER